MYLAEYIQQSIYHGAEPVIGSALITTLRSACRAERLHVLSENKRLRSILVPHSDPFRPTISADDYQNAKRILEAEARVLKQIEAEAHSQSLEGIAEDAVMVSQFVGESRSGFI